jgi:hypothetical protein
MPVKRDDRFDNRAQALIARALGQTDWVIFRHGGGYEDRLALQRAIYYYGNHGPDSSISVQWSHAGVTGPWEKLKTPRGGGTFEGTPVGRISAHTKAQARKAVRAQIDAGTAAYDNLTDR